MGNINGKGLVSGAVGPVYYRMLNGKAIVQSKPARRKKAAGTANNASDFGRAATTAKKIRMALQPVLQGFADTAMYRRFTASVHAASASDLPKGQRTLGQGNLQVLERFEFNTLTPFDKYCSVIPVVGQDAQGQLSLSIDSFDPRGAVVPPKEASHAELLCFATAFDAVTFDPLQDEIFTIPFALSASNVDASVWPLNFPENSVVLVVAALLFVRKGTAMGDLVLNNKTLHPCVLVGAALTGS
jgi:hypothetical protein